MNLRVAEELPDHGKTLAECHCTRRERVADVVTADTLRMPVTHRHGWIRTTNLLEGLFVEERWRLKIMPAAFGKKVVLKLMFGALIRAAERWLAIRASESERRQMRAITEELDHEYESRNGLDT